MTREAELEAELRRARSALEALRSVNEALRVTRDLQSLYRVVAWQMSSVLSYDAMFIAIYSAERETLRYVYQEDEGVVDEGGGEYPLSTGMLGARVVRSHEPLLIDDLEQADPNAQQTPVRFGNSRQRSRAWLGVPMISGEQVRGVISVQSYQPGVFSRSDIDLLLIVASQIGVAVENAQLLERMRQTIVDLAAPLIPVAAGVLVLPLVGAIDAERAARMLEQTLDTIVARQAEVLLIDITGVRQIDAFVVDQLMKMIRAAALIGTRCGVVGASAAAAQATVALGGDLSSFETFRDLQSALAEIVPALGAR